MSPAGYVLLAVFLLCFVYLVPALVRRRQVALDSRVDDRFSTDLRLVATAGQGARPATRHPRAAPSAPALHTRRAIAAGSTRGESVVNRPAGMTERLVAVEARRVAATRAAAAAARAERAAAARRRLVLTLALIVTGAVAWSAVAIADFSYLLALVPTVILAVVLVLGRRAAAASSRADARDAARELSMSRNRDRRTAPANSAAQLRARLGDGGAVAEKESAAAREAVPGLGMRWDAVGADTSDGGPVDRPAGRQRPESRIEDDGAGWTPVPVPVPTYTLKPTAPRRQPEPWAAPAAATGADAAEARAAETPDPLAAETRAGEPEPVSPGAGIDLSAVLARRRAAGQ
ncbi:hypothetical protein Bcav_0907 [Beutenbergia cavernae DSM 12333]|uniref:Uncharacterized protein n=1 Tax=Beutenbergia cavernae (strain ATCC BAA-8 / DSM 12333 / CCUG 43141 / JCM 11478 / NBRC 16432 / NCIMB 13614 / HKI 0122) TaxID=471853 RepID=C5BZJ6_BEUC1|nr:hypothetical protein [Beutenbergia cavernae]ACQ79168.1 hypothetical protein Bcav_0907 [Beutenbergia cavernae DSM 12333]